MGLSEEQKLQLKQKADGGSITAIQILEKEEHFAKLEAKKKEIFGSPTFVSGDKTKEIPVLDISKSISGQMLKELDLGEIEDFISSGDFKTLPEHMQVYLAWMQYAHHLYNEKDLSKFHVTKQLMAVCKSSDEKAISYYMANKIFSDMQSFFYSVKDFDKNAWLIYLAERIRMAATVLLEVNDFEGYCKQLERASNIIAKVEVPESAQDPRLLDRRPRLFSTSAKEIGAPEADRNELSREIEEMDIPESDKSRLKRDLGTEPRNMFEARNTKTGTDEG